MVDSAPRERAEPQSVEPRHKHRLSRAEKRARRRAQQSRKRRRLVGGAAIGLLVVVAVAVVGAKLWYTSFRSDGDYTGTGKRDVVIGIEAGDSTTAIGETLYHEGVIATVQVFLNAAHGNSAISSIQPGYYRMRTEIPAASAVASLTDPHNRVGKLVIPEGRQLDDTTDMKTNVVTPGILTLISRASCVDLDGNHRCVAQADLLSLIHI